MHEQAYDNPLISRYASAAMATLFGPQKRFSTWRRLWLALAEAQQELGLGIRDEQLAAIRRELDNIPLDVAARFEKELRHDVMAHVHTLGEQCPEARGILHWGATSCFVTDNADLLLFRDALGMVCTRLAAVVDALGTFAAEHRDLPTLGFTHFQPAQPTTLGKRATLWAYDFALDLAELERLAAELPFRSVKGTTGTQASFLQLFDGDHAKVERLELRVAEKLGFRQTFAVTGQTYPRKVDSRILAALADTCASGHKFATDLRLLANRKEVEEPFEAHQIGSSAMAYKRNPMRSERLCALARFVMALPTTAYQTHATQWLERTLDDSAIRRLTLPQGFLATDALLILAENISRGMVVYPQMHARHLKAELPFMVTEEILMAAVAAGGDRQVLHERIRQHSQAAAAQVKLEGAENDLLTRLAEDPAFAVIDIGNVADPRRLVGRAPQQVDQFLAEVVTPIRTRYENRQPKEEELRV